MLETTPNGQLGHQEMEDLTWAPVTGWHLGEGTGCLNLGKVGGQDGGLLPMNMEP